MPLHIRPYLSALLRDDCKPYFVLTQSNPCHRSERCERRNELWDDVQRVATIKKGEVILVNVVIF
jgi:hypothetical protein